MRELLSGQELTDEGRRLRHCVATYAASCTRGACSIWSLERRHGAEERDEPVLTIEIDGKGLMVQACGFRNRWPTDQERRVLEAWMQKAELKAAPYLYG